MFWKSCSWREMLWLMGFKNKQRRRQTQIPFGNDNKREMEQRRAQDDVSSALRRKKGKPLWASLLWFGLGYARNLRRAKPATLTRPVPSSMRELGSGVTAAFGAGTKPGSLAVAPSWKVSPPCMKLVWSV